MTYSLHILLSKIISCNDLHAKWLNTLSYLENCGARKIAACEHPTFVKEEMLKHAAEEFRHAHYLKQQIKKLTPKPFEDYSFPYILGRFSSLHYLNALDLFTSRFLIQKGKHSKDEIRKYAYPLVTYAIEMRAKEFYPIYHEVLRSMQSKVYVKSIILEEEEHLKEMEVGLRNLPSGFSFAKEICAFENTLFQKWISLIEKGLETSPHLCG